MQRKMECVKTGCHLYSREYACSFYGDLYFIGDPTEEEGFYVLKANHRASAPLSSYLHMIALKMHFWQFGDWHICFITDVEMYDHEGQEIIGDEVVSSG